MDRAQGHLIGMPKNVATIRNGGGHLVYHRPRQVSPDSWGPSFAWARIVIRSSIEEKDCWEGM